MKQSIIISCFLLILNFQSSFAEDVKIEKDVTTLSPPSLKVEEVIKDSSSATTSKETTTKDENQTLQVKTASPTEIKSAAKIEDEKFYVTATPTEVFKAVIQEESIDPTMKNLSYQCKTGEKKFSTEIIFNKVLEAPRNLNGEDYGYHGEDRYNILKSSIVINNQVLPVEMKAYIGKVLVASGEELSIGNEVLSSIADAQDLLKAKAIISEAKKKEASGNFYEVPTKIELTSGTCNASVDVIAMAPKELIDSTDKNIADVLERNKKITEEITKCEKEIITKSFKQTFVNINYCAAVKCDKWVEESILHEKKVARKSGYENKAILYGLGKYQVATENVQKNLKDEAKQHGLTLSCPANLLSSTEIQGYVLRDGSTFCSGEQKVKQKNPHDCVSLALMQYGNRNPYAMINGSLLKNTDFHDMAKSIGKMIYENKAAEIQKKKQKQDELIAAKKVALDPDEVVSKMPVPQASKINYSDDEQEQNTPETQNWVIVLP